MKINRDFFRKICGKISKVTVNKTVGFFPEDRFDFDETIYFLGIKIKHKSLKNVRVDDTILAKNLKLLSTPKEVPNRVIVKGFVKE